MRKVFSTVVSTPSTKNFFKVIPLGGLEQIGMNMTAFEYKNSIIIVDCGIAFPDEAAHPGIDAIIPDITYLRDNYNKIKDDIDVS